MKILRGRGGGFQKFFDTQKGGSDKIQGVSKNWYILNPKKREGGKLLKYWTATNGGYYNLKLPISISSFPSPASFNIKWAFPNQSFLRDILNITGEEEELQKIIMEFCKTFSISLILIYNNNYCKFHEKK